jgi:seryl-tRNA synthetase
MHEQTIELDTAVPAELTDELARRVFFVSEDITDFDLILSDGVVTAIRVQVRHPGAVADLTRKLRSMARTDVAAQRSMEQRTLWRSGRRPEVLDDPYGGLADAGLVFETGEGMVALAGPLLRLVDRLDRRLLTIAVGLGAAEFRYPTLIPTGVLVRCGYLSSFPQHLMFVTRLHTDADVYHRFAQDSAGRPAAMHSILESCRNADYALPPTMCLHTYHQLAGTAVAEQGRVVTARGKSFRFESHYRRGLERLWDFTIRETVFLGSREFVKERRAAFLDAAIALVDELDLGGRCEVATDPFFLGDSAARTWSQRMHELKYELILDIGGGREVAVGSFNLHGRFFGEPFDIRAGTTEVANTACVGFGLERLALAFVARHGLDPTRWPVDLGEDLA